MNLHLKCLGTRMWEKSVNLQELKCKMNSHQMKVNLELTNILAVITNGKTAPYISID